MLEWGSVFLRISVASGESDASDPPRSGSMTMTGIPAFVRISYGEQRLVLLVRAFVKSPELLILDEPLHGLDMGKKRLAKDIIEKYCSDPQKTLVYVSHYRDEIPSNCTMVKSL